MARNINWHRIQLIILSSLALCYFVILLYLVFNANSDDNIKLKQSINKQLADTCNNPNQTSYVCEMNNEFIQVPQTFYRTLLFCLFSGTMITLLYADARYRKIRTLL